MKLHKLIFSQLNFIIETVCSHFPTFIHDNVGLILCIKCCNASTIVILYVCVVVVVEIQYMCFTVNSQIHIYIIIFIMFVQIQILKHKGDADVVRVNEISRNC